MKNAFKKHKTIILALFILALVPSVGAGFWYFYPKSSVKTEEKPVEAVVEDKKPLLDCHYAKDELLVEINKVRSVPVKEDPRLSQIAQERANEMNGTMDNHAGFKTRFYNSPLPYGYIYLGENLATKCNTMTAWLSSPPHKETMLNLRYDTIGIAEYKNVVVTEFGDY